MLIAADTLSGVLALAFAAAGLGKFTGARRQMETADRLEIAWRRYRLISIPELAAAAGLVVGIAIAPLGAAAAIGLALLMSGAVALRVRVRDSAAFLVGDAMFFAAAVVTAVLRIASA